LGVSKSTYTSLSETHSVAGTNKAYYSFLSFGGCYCVAGLHVFTLPSPLQATQSLIRLVLASILFPEPEHTGQGIVAAGIRRILRTASGNSVYWSRVFITNL